MTAAKLSAKQQSKHQTNSAQTREQLILAAQKLYAQKGIDAVSFNEITAAAGQKNRNALQYHFGNRQNLLQAIIDRHAQVIYQLRRDSMDKLAGSDWPASKIAAHVLVMPIADYVKNHADGVEYINIISQLAVVNMPLTAQQDKAELHLIRDKAFSKIINQALTELKPTEAKRRIFLAVRFTFHSIADIYRAAQSSNAKQPDRSICDHNKMVEQIVLTIDSMFSAPAI